MRFGTCPVCGKEEELVRHHDHYGDMCERVIEKHFDGLGVPREDRCLYPLGQIRWQDEYWATFPETEICSDCNHIDVVVKKRFQWLPRWVSFSPDEMIVLQEDSSEPVVQMIWVRKCELYREYNRKMVEAGIAKETIEAVWKDRTWGGQSNSEQFRQSMLKLYEQAPREFKALCEYPRNELLLAKHIRQMHWDDASINSFIYWYHKKHGNPSLNNPEMNYRHLRPGRMQGWWNVLAKEGEVQAQRYLDGKRGWRPKTLKEEHVETRTEWLRKNDMWEWGNDIREEMRNSW